MSVLLLTLFLQPPIVVPIPVPVPVPVPVVVPAAGNEPVWIWMPMDTAAQRAAREKARKQWASRKRAIDGIAAAADRKKRIAEAKNYQLQQYRQRQQTYQQRYQSGSYSYGQRWRTIYVNTPFGRVAYRVPY
tara:strand:+ start:131 stop:526 length:396 start_codon:yes stop_codon:yes gene_type:complete